MNVLFKYPIPSPNFEGTCEHTARKWNHHHEQTTDKISVSTARTLELPSRNFTIGTKAIKIIRSLVATCYHRISRIALCEQR